VEPPDAYEYAPDALRLYWYEPMIAVIVDLDDAEAPMVI
jgi:hypothetical protein